MHCVRNVTEDLYWVGANDHRLTLFENIHPIPTGVSYNSYLLLDEQAVLFDSVDWSACRQLLDNLFHLLGQRPLDALIINHIEPDHGASVEEVMVRYPNVKLIGTEMAFTLMRQFGYSLEGHELVEVKQGDTLCFGRHTLTFFGAPMVHWPETMVTFDTTNGALFTGDAFGSFTALDGKLFDDELNFERDWISEARRYYANIVGKYGLHVQRMLDKMEGVWDQVCYLCPLHGPVWRGNLSYPVEKYRRWSVYQPEERGVLMVYASMYGNTESAAQALAAKLAERGISNTALYDVSNTHVSYLIAETFRLSHVVLASVTYNLGIYPVMHSYLMDMKALNLQKRTFALLENGSWASRAGDLMQEFITQELRYSTVLEPRLSLTSSMREDQEGEMDALADAIAASVREE